MPDHVAAELAGDISTVAQVGDVHASLTNEAAALHAG